jgi:hypothetical protein
MNVNYWRIQDFENMCCGHYSVADTTFWHLILHVLCKENGVQNATLIVFIFKLLPELLGKRFYWYPKAFVLDLYKCCGHYRIWQNCYPANEIDKKNNRYTIWHAMISVHDKCIRV